MGHPPPKATPTPAPKPVPSKPPKQIGKQNGRRTKSDLELWTRRFEAVRLIAMGFPIGEIALKQSIDRKTVSADLSAYQLIAKEFGKSGINKLELSFEEAKRQAFTKLAGAEPAAAAQLLRVIVEITKEEAILTGRRRVEGTGRINVTAQAAAIAAPPSGFSVKEKLEGVGTKGLKRLADLLADPNIEEAEIMDAPKVQTKKK